MAEYNEIEEIIIPEVPKVLENEQINVYVPMATYDWPGIIRPFGQHFEFDNRDYSLKLKQSIVDTIGIGTPILPSDRPNETGLVRLANSTYVNLNRHVDSKIDQGDVSIDVDPHHAQKAIRERIAAHNSDKTAHPHMLSMIRENADKIKTYLSYLEGEGRIFTIPTWNDLKTAINNPSLRVFKAKGLDLESDYARLLDLVTGDTILVLEKNRPDFYIVTSDRMDDGFFLSDGVEKYENTRLYYRDPVTKDVSGFLFMYGVPLTYLKEYGYRNIISNDVDVYDDAIENFAFGFDIGIGGSSNTVFGSDVIVEGGSYSSVFGKDIKIHSSSGGNILAGLWHGENRYESGENCDYSAIFGIGNDVGQWCLIAGNNNLGIGLIAPNGAFAAGRGNRFHNYGGVVGRSNSIGSYGFSSGLNNVSGDYSIASGDGNFCGNYSIVSGEGNQAGDHSAVFGKNNITIDFGLSVGSDNVSDDSYNYIFGIENNSEQIVGSDFGSILSKYNAIFGRKNAVCGGLANLVSGSSNKLSESTENIVTGSNNEIEGYADLSKYNAVFGFKNYVGHDGSPDSRHAYSENLVVGESNKAKSSRSAIIGLENTDNGGLSLIVGNKNSASSHCSFISGYSNDVAGYDDGYGVSGYNSVSGLSNSVHGVQCVVLGTMNEVSNDDCCVIGKSNAVDQIESFAFGVNNLVSSSYSTAIGKANVIEAPYTDVFGRGLDASADAAPYGRCIVGGWNRRNANTTHPSGTIFEVGVGSSEVRRTGFSVYSNQDRTIFEFGDVDDAGGKTVVDNNDIKNVFDTANRGVADSLSDVGAGETQLVSAIGLRAYVEDYVSKELGVLEDILESIA